MLEIAFVIVLVVTVGVPASVACASTTFAALTAPPGRHGRMRFGHLASGAFVAGLGLLVMGVAAWSTREEGHYDDFGSAMTLLAAVTVTVTMLAAASAAQASAEYVPASRPGALVVRWPEHPGTARAAVQRELPGVAVVQGLGPASRYDLTVGPTTTRPRRRTSVTRRCCATSRATRRSRTTRAGP